MLTTEAAKPHVQVGTFHQVFNPLTSWQRGSVKRPQTRAKVASGSFSRKFSNAAHQSEDALLKVLLEYAATLISRCLLSCLVKAARSTGGHSEMNSH